MYKVIKYLFFNDFVQRFFYHPLLAPLDSIPAYLHVSVAAVSHYHPFIAMRFGPKL